jgi:hypothetical protein
VVGPLLFVEVPWLFVLGPLLFVVETLFAVGATLTFVVAILVLMLEPSLPLAAPEPILLFDPIWEPMPGPLDPPGDVVAASP